MENLKVKVANESESKEVQGLFFKLGAKSRPLLENWKNNNYQSAWFAIGPSRELFNEVIYRDNDSGIYNSDLYKEITLPELRDMVVLKRNDVGDATHVLENGLKLYKDSKGNFFKMHRRFENDLARWVELDYSCNGAKPIEKPMREYLVKSQDGKWCLETDFTGDPADEVIEVPEGAEIYIELTRKIGGFYKDNFKQTYLDDDGWVGTIASIGYDWNAHIVLWQRETLNDQVASAEAYRQEEVLPMLDIEFPSEQEIKDERLNRGDVNYRVAKAFNEIRGTDLTEDDIDYLRKFIDLTNSHYGV